MPAFDLTTDKLVTTATGALDDPALLDARVLLTRLLISLGFNQIVIASTPPAVPANARNLWWDKGVNTLKRYNPLTSQWAALNANQHVMHLFQRAAIAAGTDAVIETGDLFYMFDVSRDELRTISEATLRGLINSEVVGVITSSSTEFIIDLTSLTPDVYYEFKGVIKWVTSGNPLVRMRQRSSSNANLNMIRNYASGNPGEGDEVTFYPPHGVEVPDTTKSIIPLFFSFSVHSSPRKCAIAFGRHGNMEWQLVETNSATAAAKIHFTLPANVTMNGKVLKP